MKRLIQLNLLLLLVSSTAAQEVSPQVPALQQSTKILRIYDWNELVQQHQLAGGEVIQMDGVSVLKIENTNSINLVTNYMGLGFDRKPVYVVDMPLEVSLLKITNSVLNRTYWVSCELKYENVRKGMFQQSDGSDHKWVQVDQSAGLGLNVFNTPSAPGGDERLHFSSYDFDGSSNWKLHQFAVERSESEGSPTRLSLHLILAGPGTVYIRPIKLLGMSGSWWSAKQGGMIGGAVGIFGGMIGCFGGLLGCLAGFGKARKFVLTTTKIFIALGMLLTITGIVAIACAQPFFVWYAFLLPGVILTLIFSLNFPLIQRRYDDLEIRRMVSLDV